MTDLRDKIADTVREYRTHQRRDTDTADAILALTRENVPPLEWMDALFEQDADLVDTTETYQIQEGLFWYGCQVNGVYCGSNEAAKSAANEHHRQAVLKQVGLSHE